MVALFSKKAGDVWKGVQKRFPEEPPNPINTMLFPKLACSMSGAHTFCSLSVPPSCLPPPTLRTHVLQSARGCVFKDLCKMSCMGGWDPHPPTPCKAKSSCVGGGSEPSPPTPTCKTQNRISKLVLSGPKYRAQAKTYPEGIAHPHVLARAAFSHNRFPKRPSDPRV